MLRTLALALYATAAAAEAPPPTAEQTEQVAAQVREAGLTDAAVAKLSGEQLHDILRHDTKSEPVAIIAVIGFFIALTVTVLASLYALYRIYRQRSETLRLMVEKGVPIPPELIAPTPRAAADLRRGLVLTAFGLGLAIFLGAVGEERGVWTLGLIPLLVGVGYMVASRLKPGSATTA